MKRFSLLSIFLMIILIMTTFPQDVYAQGRRVEPAGQGTEGEGPYERLILHGAYVIDGTGAVTFGPSQIAIEGNRITRIRGAGTPGMPIRPAPQAKSGERVIDVSGMYIMPGFVDMHEHIGSTGGLTAEYVYKLWLGHGITTIREVGTRFSLETLIDQRNKSWNNEITAPRIMAYHVIRGGTEEEVRENLRNNAAAGVDGVKIFGFSPKLYAAILDEAKKLGLRSACHLPQSSVGRINMLDLARMGLTTMEHWYGLPESFFDNETIQDWPIDAVYGNEQDRFGQAGRLWKQAAKPYSKKWNEVMDELIDLDFTLVPTLTIYEASRDLMKARRNEWHDEYTIPALWRFFEPSRRSHGAYWFYWTTKDEIEWKNNYKLWMTFLNEYKNRGGRVATGADSGFIYNLWGFGYIREFELFQEAGFHPLEVIKAATLEGAEALGLEDELGTVEVGKLADLVVVDANPLENFKVLYGTGAIKLNENNVVERIGGVKYTIKDGVVYDSKELLEDVKKMVMDAKRKENFEIVQPGIKKNNK